MASRTGGRSIESSPLEENDRLLLEQHEPTICKLMDPDLISHLLISKGVIDHSDRREIMVPQILGDKNRVLLGRLFTRGPEAFKNYLNALNESGTEKHAKLYNILQKPDEPPPGLLPVEVPLADARHKRTTEKIEDHEKRLKTLEHEIKEGCEDEAEVESLRAELSQRHKEIEELKHQLETQDEELKKCFEGNEALNKRIQSLEKKIETLQTCLKQQIEYMQKQQQEDKRRIKDLEEKNTKLSSDVANVDMAEKDMERKLQEQTEKHDKDMEDIRREVGLLRHPTKPTVAVKASGIIPRNRFDKAPASTTRFHGGSKSDRGQKKACEENPGKSSEIPPGNKATAKKP